MRTVQTIPAPTPAPPGRIAGRYRRHRPVPAALTAAFVAALAWPLTAPASPAAAVDGVGVTATGSTVRASTSACPDGGNASLLSSGQAIFAQGRQATLNTAGTSQSASWQNVSSGSHTVIVMCSDGTTAGTGTVTVSGGTLTAPSGSPAATSQPPTTAPATTTPSPSASPALGVQGGLGGSATDMGPLTTAVGGTMVAAAAGFGAWCLHRRRTRSSG